jgi:hypothetical protein
MIVFREATLNLQMLVTSARISFRCGYKPFFLSIYACVIFNRISGFCIVLIYSTTSVSTKLFCKKSFPFSVIEYIEGVPLSKFSDNNVLELCLVRFETFSYRNITDKDTMFVAICKAKIIVPAKRPLLQMLCCPPALGKGAVS